jgi:hypothetical protein
MQQKNIRSTDVISPSQGIGRHRGIRKTVELGIVLSAVAVALAGCLGGGGSSGSGASSTVGAVSGQFWTDLTGAGIRSFYFGIPALGLPATGYVSTATFSNGNYNMPSVMKSLSGGVWSVTPQNYYALTTSGWSLESSSINISATNANSFTYTDPAFGLTTVAITTTDLSGKAIVASSAVPAVDSLGASSFVSPATANYPSGSFEYVFSSSANLTTSAYTLTAVSAWQVTTTTIPITAANFSATGFAAHSQADPICVVGLGLFLAHSSGATYNSYYPTLNAGVPSGTPNTCQNSNIAAARSNGTLDLTFSTVNGVPIVSFLNPTGVNLFANLGNQFIGFLPTLGNAYYGTVVLPGSSTGTSYWLNQTAMNAALQAWSVPVF